jgi:hypothetical protein
VWLKAHLMVGVRTNVVTSVEVTPGTHHDSPYLPQLVNATPERFAVREVSADKGYISRSNLAAVDAVGAVPYIPFKSNTTGEGPDLWRRLYHTTSTSTATTSGVTTTSAATSRRRSP